SAASIQQLQAGIVLTRHHAHRLGQTLDPGRKAFLLFTPGLSLSTTLDGVDVDRTMRVRDPLHKVLAAGVANASAPRRKCAKSKVPQATLEQMLRREAAYGAVVDADVWNRWIGPLAAQVNYRLATAQHRASHRSIANSGENAISLPRSQPRRRRSAQPMRL